MKTQAVLTTGNNKTITAHSTNFIVRFTEFVITIIIIIMNLTGTQCGIDIKIETRPAFYHNTRVA